MYHNSDFAVLLLEIEEICRTYIRTHLTIHVILPFLPSLSLSVSVSLSLSLSLSCCVIYVKLLHIKASIDAYKQKTARLLSINMQLQLCSQNLKFDNQLILLHLDTLNWYSFILLLAAMNVVINHPAFFSSV